MRGTISDATRTTLAVLATLAAAVLLAGATPNAVGALPSGFTDTLVASVENPTALAFTPDGRLLVTTQFGALRVVEDGTLSPTPALDLGAALCTANEMGLLGVAVDPAFAANGFVYLYSSRSADGECANRVSRYTMSGDTIAPASELVLVDGIPATSGNHNGGDLHFGRDGYLYVSVGDAGCDYAGGGCYGQNDAARDEHALVGKILRITSTGGIPPDNPFQGGGTARCNVTGRTTAGTKCQETFAWGLRNPFRIAFDPNAAGTRFFVNDVGDGAWEEVNAGQAGADYGWNVREGPCANGSQTDCGAPPAGMTNPTYAYSHSESSCHAITGGAFVPNGVWPAGYDGSYLYGDYTCGTIFQLTPNGGGYTRTEFATDVGAVVNLAFGPSPQGQALYYTNYTNGGEVRRIESTGAGNRPPTARISASPTAGPLPLTVTLDGSASTDPDAGDTLTYTWSFGDGSPPQTTTTPTVGHTYTSAGRVTATLTVRDEEGAASPPATIELDPGNAPPQVAIDTPTAADRFAVGQAIALQATATDAEDGPLAPSRLTWRVLRRHDAHTHPFLAPTAGNGVQITQPAPEDLASGVEGYLEIQVTATDSRGLSTTVTRNAYPRKVELTFASNPAGRNVVVAGTTYATTATLTSWAGHAIDVDAPPQTDGSGRSFTFQSWSDGGAAAHTIVTPSTPTTYTATFSESAVSPGLVAAYGFESGSGNTVPDSSGRGNNGSLSGAARSAAGRFGSALSFDGVNDWVTVPDASSLDLTSAMTVEAWVRPTALGGWRTVALKERSGGMVYSLYASQGSRPVGQVWIDGERDALGSSAVPLNAWTHLAATFDGAVLRLYVNGVLASSTPVTGSLTPSSGPLRIGGNSVWSEWFAGLIDEVRVYERALSAGEIQQDMQTPVEGAAVPDGTPPGAPTGLSASVGPGRVDLGWSSSADDVGVVRYNVHRSQSPGFAVAAANRIAQPVATAYSDSGLAAGTYYYRVTAEDAAGNVSAPSGELTAVVAGAPAASGLVAAYGFGAGSGSAVGDSSGRGNSGTLSGASWVAGRNGMGLRFDGVNDWVTVPDSASLDLTSAMTLEAWALPSALGGWRTLVFKERAGGVVYNLVADQGGGRPAGQVVVGGAERTTSGPAPLPVGAWSHLAATFDGSALRLYVNGALASTTAVSGAMVPSTGVLRLGGNSVWSEWFAGVLDDVRIYNRALTAGEIQQDMQTPVEGAAAPDGTPPGAPTGLSASVGPGRADLGWSSSADDVGVVRYNVHRSQSPGFAVAAANRIAQPTANGYTDSGLPPGRYYYRVTAEDAAGNVSDPSSELAVDIPDQPPPASGLILAFGFGAGSGAVVADSSGRNNRGTISGAAWTTGRNGAGLSFDGVNDWVTVPDANSLDLSSGMTLDAWVRPTRLGGWRTIVFKERAGGVVYGLYADQGGGRPLGQVDIGGERNAVGSASLPLNTWSHLAVTYDGAVVRLYVNGTLAGSFSYTGVIPASTGVLRLGGNSVWSEWFAGVLDDVRIYNRALTAAEIQQDMQTPVG